MSYALWFVQVMLAIVFLSAGGVKLALPVEMLGLPFQLPAVFVRFIGLCEVLGAWVDPAWRVARSDRTYATGRIRAHCDHGRRDDVHAAGPDPACDRANWCGASRSLCGVRPIACCAATASKRGR